MAWAEDYRQGWIKESLRVYGYLNRGHLMRKFGISTPQASLDLAKFQRENPDAVVYDRTQKRYVAKELVGVV